MVYSKNLTEKYNVDIFVAGGGAAGVAAAIAASKQGKSVFLAEATGAFGGLGTSGLVPSFAPFGDGINMLASGIGLDIRKKVSKAFPIDIYWAPINAEELKRVYDDEMISAGVEFSFFTTVCDVVVSDGHIDYVVCTAKSGMFAVKAKIYIDCTGDGDLCYLGGGDYTVGEGDGKVMPGTLCSLWANIDWSNVSGPQNAFIEKAYSDGVLSYEDRHLPGMFKRDDLLGGGNIGHLFNIDPTDEKSLTNSMIWGRKSMLEYERYYKKYLKGFENMILCATGSVPGVRESRRITCDYALCVDDFISRAVFEDEIGRYCYPVDIHVMNTDKKEYERFSNEYENLRYKQGESYGIPYRSLISKSFSNLLTAGRCMGTDRKMQASIRVMPGCFITGQAAGAAAALASNCGDVRKINHSLLVSELKKLGAFLPNS